MTLRRIEVAVNGRTWGRLVPDSQPAAPVVRSRAPLPTIRPACRWEGDIAQACPRGDECLHVRHCLSDAPEWGRCTRGPNSRKDSDIGSCATCPHHELASEPRRHLIYHLYPGQGWRQRAAAVVSRWGLFTGTVHVAAALDSGTVPLADVRAAFPSDADVFEVKNNPSNKDRERVSWEPLWGRVLAHAADNDLVWRMHSKATSPWRQGNPALLWWTEISEALLLDQWPLVLAQLAAKPIVGTFRTPYGWAGGSWHYSGSYYVVRAGEAKRRGLDIEESTWGVESWPGRKFTLAEAAELWPVTGGPHLYDARNWQGDGKLLTQYAEWLRANPPALVPR